MTRLSQFFRKLRRYLSSNRRISFAGLGIVLLIMYFLFRHSSHSALRENLYYIGEDNRWKEAQLYGKEKNFSAFSHDVLAAIAKEEKIRFKLINTRTNELEKKLLEGEFQGILSSMQPSQIKQRTYLFSHIYYALGPVLTVSMATQIEGWNEMARKIVGVYASSPTILELQQDHNIQIKLYDDIKKALVDLDNHKIDGVIFPVLPSLLYTQTFYPGRLKVATLPLDDEGIHLVALKDKRGEKLIEHFNHGLEVIKENGTYQELLKRWDLVDTEIANDDKT